MMEEVTLSRVFGDEVGRWFQDLLESKGIEVRGGEELEAFEGDGRVQAVVTKSGEAVEGGMVVVGAGVRPDVMLAERAGLEVDDGIVCDATLQTSAEGIYAAGDVCSWQSEQFGRRMRVEHWDVALQQGRHAAKGMMGEGEPYARGALLLQRPRRLGRARVRRQRRRTGTRSSGAATATPASSRAGT